MSFLGAKVVVQVFRLQAKCGGLYFSCMAFLTLGPSSQQLGPESLESGPGCAAMSVKTLDSRSKPSYQIVKVRKDARSEFGVHVVSCSLLPHGFPHPAARCLSFWGQRSWCRCSGCEQSVEFTVVNMIITAPA